MQLSIQEQAIVHFYEWDYRLRGYWLFDQPVEIEPPFIPFTRPTYTTPAGYDDGRSSGLISRTLKFLNTPQKEEEPEQANIIVPYALENNSRRICIKLSFSGKESIKPDQAQAFVAMLSFTDESISFEIVGTKEAITIQFTCAESDAIRLKSQLRAYFPNAVLKETDALDLPFSEEYDIAVADLGLAEESVRPVSMGETWKYDPLTSIISSLENLENQEVAIFQAIFKGTDLPWGQALNQSVQDGTGGAFFEESPEMLTCAKDKTNAPLYFAVLRIAAQSPKPERSSFIAKEIIRNIRIESESTHNHLFPLSNENYDYDQHVLNIFYRTSNRWGMLLNAKEIATWVHYPDAQVVSQKLRGAQSKTKKVPDTCINQKYAIGKNYHINENKPVSLSDEQRLKHTHILGATGMGKSTLLAKMIKEDMLKGNGCAIIDPHGDLIETILKMIPKERVNDVVLIDPSDIDYPIGFNLFQADTEAEKIVLSSDLISAFREQSSSWGDVIHSILANAINTFLESERGGTIIELKRFLIEPKYRKEYLKTVTDASIQYYWKHDYPRLKKGSLAPLLMRIDSFLHSKTIRYMLAQKNGFDFKTAINDNQIILIKLSQGLVGMHNAFLLGSIFLSKIYQVALSRQQTKSENRNNFYLYIDEFQNFVTDSISQTLSGARKYKIGLTIANQQLSQIEDASVLHSVMSNVNTRICFRLSQRDSVRLESEFSSFQSEDFANLGVGQAIMKVGQSTHDFSLETEPLECEEGGIKAQIIQRSRDKYAKTKEEVEAILEETLQFSGDSKKEKKESNKDSDPADELEALKTNIEEEWKETEANEKSTEFEAKQERYLKQAKEQQEVREHRFIQTYIKRIAEGLGWKASIEEQLPDGGRVDVSLQNGNAKIACEVSVTNSVQYEVKNIEKCIAAKYTKVFVVSNNEKHLASIKTEAKERIDTKDQSKLFFLNSEEVAEHLSKLQPKSKKTQKKFKGFRVKVNFVTGKETANDRKRSLVELIRNGLGN